MTGMSAGVLPADGMSSIGGSTLAVSGSAFYVPRIVDVLRNQGGKAKASTVRAAIVDGMIANGDFIDETEVSGEPKYKVEIRFARLNLVEAGMLEKTEISGYGTWQLTRAGWEMPLDAITAAAISKKSTTASTKQVLAPESLQDDLPGVGQGDKELQQLLLQLSDIGFERLCAAIMTANNAEVQLSNGKAGDGGIDGTASFSVDSLALVSFRVAWQCKRYATERKIQPFEVREFRGALDHGFQHGVFFTTSTFTVKAEDEARRAGQIPIRIVDISGLIGLLKEKELGLSKQPGGSFLIDHAYFEKFKSTGLTGWEGNTLFNKKGKP